jgi:phosphoadenosine phosphosulfate reductase
MERTITKHQIENWNDFLKDKTTNEILEWAQEEFKDQLFQTTSFGLTGLVTIDLLKAKVPLIFIDTLHNFSETYKLVNDIQTKYHVKIHKFYPKHEQEIKTKTMFVEVFGDELWKTDSVKYDYVVKAEPGFRANKELNAKAVLTGRRRSQGADRKSLDIVELDSSGIVKINALYSWSFDQCWDYIKANNVPYNALTDQGYKSIGDYHSTAKTLEGEGERDGRWKGQEKTECGLHKDYFKMKREQKMK